MAERENKQSIEERRSGEEFFAGYKGGEEMPLAGYAALLGIYNAAFLALMLAAQNPKTDCLQKSISPIYFYWAWRLTNYAGLSLLIA